MCASFKKIIIINVRWVMIFGLTLDNDGVTSNYDLDSGVLPVRLLSENRSSSTSVRFPIVEGIGPEKLEPTRFKDVNFVRLPIHDGICCLETLHSMNAKDAKVARYPIWCGIGT